MAIAALIFIGFLIGLKCTLMAQFVTLVMVGVFLACLAGRDLIDIFVGVILIFVLFWLALGMGIGDAMYYHDYYKGTATIGDFFGWFLKP